MADLKPQPHKDSDDRSSFNQLTKFVRVRSSMNSRFVEFDFAIGDPALFVELIMPPDAFNHFCKANDVVFMTEQQQQVVDAEMDKWRYGEETLMAKNHR